MQYYPLPNNFLGVEYVAELKHIVSSTALKFPDLGEQPRLFDAVLEPDNLHRGWRIRCDYGYLGWLDKEESAGYPLLERIRNAHMVVSTWATVTIVNNSLKIAVFLGLAPWQIPVNNAPHGSLMLNSGLGCPLHPALDLDTLEAMGTRQFLCQVKYTGSSFHAVVEGTTLGIFYPPEHVAKTLTNAAEKGLNICARAYSAGSLLALDFPADPNTPFVMIPPALDNPQPVVPHVAHQESFEVGISTDALAQHVLTPLPSGPRPLPSPQ